MSSSNFECFLVDGQWGSWSPWSKCTRTCGQGRIKRYRKCISPAPANGGKTCPGDRRQSEGCNKDPCGEAELNKRFLNACFRCEDDVDLEEIQRLLRAGADINITDSASRTCLMSDALSLERKIYGYRERTL